MTTNAQLKALAKFMPEMFTLGRLTDTLQWMRGRYVEETEMLHVLTLAEGKLSRGQKQIFMVNLANTVLKGIFSVASTFYISEINELFNATWQQRLEALLKTVGLWKS